jgi:hypothetical protein
MKQDVDKQVRSLTKLTKDHVVAKLAAGYFDSVHPLPKVYLFAFVHLLSNSFSSGDLSLCLYYFAD